MNKRKKDDIIKSTDARNEFIMEDIQRREKEILKKHKYSVWQGKDGSWYTYIPDESKKSRRRLVKRKQYGKLLMEVDESIRAMEKKQGRGRKMKKEQKKGIEQSPGKSKELTFERLYEEWIQYKLIIANSSGTVYRHTVEWNRFYKGTKFVKIPVKKMDTIAINIFLHTQIKSKNLTRKQFNNMATILRQGLKYALLKGYITKNPYDMVEIDSRLFVREKKKPDETQVFLVDEEPLLIERVLDDYKEGKVDTAGLAIVVAFKTGLRLGELVALRFGDIKGNCLMIQRMEVKEYEMEADATMHYNGVRVVEHTKTDNSVRNVYLPSFVRELLEGIREDNRKAKNQEEDFIFCRRGKRMHSLAVEKTIYAYCEKLGISRKSMHKIRKTYISTLIDGNININKIRQLVGHADERTTYGSYCYNRYSESQTDAMLENILA